MTDKQNMATEEAQKLIKEMHEAVTPYLKRMEKLFGGEWVADIKRKEEVKL